MAADRHKSGWLRWLAQKAGALVGAVLITLGIFLILPVMQTISNPGSETLDVRTADIAELEPPPPPPSEPDREEEPEPEEPPELQEQAQQLDLSQLELALNPGMGDGAFGDFAANLGQQIEQATSEEDIDRVFSLAELDKPPRALVKPAPRYPRELRKQGRQGTVYVLFKVNESGRVSEVKVKKSTDPAFEQHAVDAVRRWRFEPGTINGKKVSFTMMIPITFNAG